MKRRRYKARKIYKTKEKNYFGKSPFGKFMSGALTVLLIGGIGFLGYSAAEPIINFTQHRGDEPDEIADATNPEDLTEGLVTYAATDAVETQSIVTETATEAAPIIAEDYTACALRITDMYGIDSLETALVGIPTDQNIKYVEVPLKASGGYIFYASQRYEAQASGAIVTQLSASDIAQLITSRGYIPVANISAFRDNIVVQSFPEMGYSSVLDGSMWLDGTAEAGGKPAPSPYSEAYVNYLGDVVNEVTAAGYTHVICSDLVYPDFTDEDLQRLDTRLSSDERADQIISAANRLYDTAAANSASMTIEVSAADILRGQTDVLDAGTLSVGTVVLNIDIAELSKGVADAHTYYEFNGTASEIAQKCIGLTADKVKDFDVMIRISGDTVPYNELIEAKRSVAEYGYTSFVIG